MIDRLPRVVGGSILGVSILLALVACAPSAPTAPTGTTTPPVPPASPAPRATSTPDLPAIVMALAAPTMLGTYPSPDGARTAEVTVYDCVTTPAGETLAYDVLEISVSAGGARSVAASQLQYCGGLGAHGLQGLFWSPNSRYFYFTDARIGVPDGGCSLWLGSMARVDVQDGSVEDLGGAVVSPDGTMIASWISDDLVLWSVDGPDGVRIPAAVPGAVNGPIAWGPDGLALAYVQTAEMCPPWGTSTIVRHRLGEAASVILLESEAPSFVQAEWAQADRLRLFDADGEVWTYDLTDDRLTGPG